MFSTRRSFPGRTDHEKNSCTDSRVASCLHATLAEFDLEAESAAPMLTQDILAQTMAALGTQYGALTAVACAEYHA
jgi:hypothetical protein